MPESSNQSGDFVPMACLNYLSHGDMNFDRAREVIAADPSIAGRDIYHAFCAGDLDAVKRMKTPANEAGGCFGREPLMYAC